jgi:hypothetical protein
MESNQAKINEASSLLKDINEHDYDFNKKMELLDKANSLIAEVNSELNSNDKQSDSSTPTTKHNSKVKPVSKPNSISNQRSQIVFQDKSVTASLPQQNDLGSSVTTSASHEQQINNIKGSSHESLTDKEEDNTPSGEVHMSRKQYRETLKKQNNN